MSHQFSFYATPADIAEMESIIRKRDPFKILDWKSPMADPKIVPSLAFVENERPLSFFFLVREADLARVRNLYVPTQRYWAIDLDKSPVIEFTRGSFVGKALRPGRVYYHRGFYDDSGSWVEHSSEFLAWAKWLFGALKRSMTRIEGSSDYAGKHAMAWSQQEGGRFEPIPIV